MLLYFLNACWVSGFCSGHSGALGSSTGKRLIRQQESRKQAAPGPKATRTGARTGSRSGASRANRGYIARLLV
jgi:hypothetical protein